MRYSIRYRTEYHYDAPVVDNLNALRGLPATTPTQRCEESGVRVDPEARLIQHLDYFGTRVVEFGVSRPHDHLTIDLRAKVDTTDPAEPVPSGWETLASPAYRAAGAEFLLPSIDEPPNGVLAELTSQARASTPLATVQLLTELIPDRFEYRPGVTYVGSTVADLLAAGAGVCQDFVHLALIVLRRHGIAARYVSGYLFAAPADEGADSVEVNTHAWVEALLPTEPGQEWVGLDPTNRGLAGAQHVKIGHGRRYGDVPPIKGVYRGAAGAALEAKVRMTRLDSANGSRP